MAATVLASAPRPFPLNGVLTSELRAPASYLTPGPVAPPIYRYLASLPDSTVIAELPFGDLWYNTRYLYFSSFHWRRMVNGFTSFYPASYTERAPWLVNPVRTPTKRGGHSPRAAPRTSSCTLARGMRGTRVGWKSG